ncbi:L-lactate permease [Paenibacillus xerothermodurans]|uniref:L-lactate permease n=1 Tax=Paenibacillus xerothermodurans TaxID=1977292 RepID=A0A2W1NYP6_PAEXE|nr:lactate permease LctP family transporter [Paenibacillus xerothermodurans]PZE20652.1 L-lactate permease [Paenibacillus xerothermodurans]
MTWTQNFIPVNGSLALSALVAIVPTLFFFWALAIKRMKGIYAGLATLSVCLLIAVTAYGMPVTMALMSAVQGGVYGIIPIAWIIVTAVFLYKLTVKTGQFEIIRTSIVSITEDSRLQLLLIAFCFGAFLEGAAGFGAPVAICAALLIGLGFSPLSAAGLCLLADTAPVAFGSIGIPITAVAGPTGLPVQDISKMVGRQLPFISVFIPLYMVVVMVGWKKTKEVLPAIVVTGVSFALTQFLTSNFLGPELPDILSALVSMLCLTLFLKVWKPQSISRFAEQEAMAAIAATSEVPNAPHSAGKVLKAWSPFLVLTIFISLWGVSGFKDALVGGYKGNNGFLEAINMIGRALSFHPTVPGLHNLIIGADGQPIPAIFKLDLLGAAGTAVLFAAVVSKFILAVPWRTWWTTFGETVHELRIPLLTICSVVGFAYVTNSSGMSITLGKAVASAGMLFPLVSPLLGWLGVFITGSDTSSNMLFGNLQKVSATSIGMSPVLAVAANCSGGVMGKMISPQSIAVACAAVGMSGSESKLFRFTVRHSIFLVLLVCVITYLQFSVFSWMVP